MKNFTFLIFILPFLLISESSFAQKKTVSGEVNFIGESGGTISVRSVGYGKNKIEATDDAEIRAMEVIFFRGISGSSLKDPLISTNSDDVKNKNQGFFDKFYNEKQYKTYITSSIPTTDNLIKNKGGMKSLVVDIVINIKALKMNLEENNIIRKFGF